MADCPNPIPTATLFGPSLVPTSSVSTSISSEFHTITSDSLVTVTSCLVSASTGTGGCVSSRVITTLSGTIVTSTILHTSLQTLPVTDTITVPTQTLYAPCQTTPQNPPPPPTSNDPPPPPDTTSSQDNNNSGSKPDETSERNLTVTETHTFTDSNGQTHTSLSESVTNTSGPSPNGSAKSNTNTTAIIAGVVGGIVGLLILIGIVWYILWRKRSGRWDDIWEENDEDGHGGAAEIKPGRGTTKRRQFNLEDDNSSTKPYEYGLVGGRGTPSPLVPTASLAHSHSASGASSTMAYGDHGRSNSQTPLMSATSPPQSPPNNTVPMIPPQHVGGSGLERTRTPVWASAAAQQTYFSGYGPGGGPPEPAPTSPSTYGGTSRSTSYAASSTHGLISHVSPTHTASNPPTAYPPGAAPPAIGGGGRYGNDYHKPPLEPTLRGVMQPLPPHQLNPPHAATSLLDVSADNDSEFHAAIAASAAASGSTGQPVVPRRSEKRSEKSAMAMGVVGDLPMSPTSPAMASPIPRQLGDPVRVAQDAGRAPSATPAPLEDAPPAYTQLAGER